MRTFSLNKLRSGNIRFLLLTCLGSWLLILCSYNHIQAQSLQLTGSVQWVNIGDLDITGNQITVEALINYQGGVNVISKHTGPPNVNYLLRPSTFEITTTTQFYLMNNPYTLQTNTWYHIAGVYNGSTISYYVNGCLVIQQAASGNMVTNNLATAIGNISSNPYGEQFIGMIDEVRIWNTARTQAEIAANMNDLPNPATYPNLRGYYKFTNNLLNSGNSGANNGTGVGAYGFGPEPPIIQQLSIVSVTPTNVTCFGLNNGSVTITASGSGVQYSINGTTYQAGNTFNNLTPGNYTAYIRSAEGCILSQAFSITQPAQLTSTTNATICSNQTYAFGGNNYNTAGTYSVVNPGTGGCDSTATLNLSVIPATGAPPAAATFNTANDGAGGVLAGGTPDATWTFATNNINGPYSPAIVMSSTPGSYYNSPWPDCDWISHVADGSHGGNVDYFYQRQFNLPCFNNCGQSYADDGVFCLSLDFFTDNSVFEIFVNGIPQSPNLGGIIPVPNQYGNVGFSQAGMVSVTLCNDWQPGINTLTIQVSSGGPYAAFLAQASINPPIQPTDTLSAQICPGETIIFGGTQYNAVGQFTHTFQTVNGCDSLVTLDLSFHPQPDVLYTGVLEFCGTEAELSANAIVNPPSTIDSYSWYTQGNNVPFGSGDSLTNNFSGANPTTTQTIHIVANSSDGCSDTATLSITLYATPNADFDWEDLCNGADIQFTDDSNWNGNPQAGGTLLHGWSFGDTQTGTGATPIHSYSTPGNYSVTLIVGSSESSCADTISANITVHPEPQITLNISPPECGQTFAFDADVIPNNHIETYDWNFGDGNSSNDSTISHTYQQAGTYNLTFTVNTDYDCAFNTTETITVDPSAEINTVVIPNIITPNGDPVNEALLLDTLFPECVEYEMKIMNRWGNLIYTQTKGSVPFNGKGMFGTLVSPGVYFYVITSGSEEKAGTITVTY